MRYRCCSSRAAQAQQLLHVRCHEITRCHHHYNSPGLHCGRYPHAAAALHHQQRVRPLGIQQRLEEWGR